jgi:hypothetical protein
MTCEYFGHFTSSRMFLPPSPISAAGGPLEIDAPWPDHGAAQDCAEVPLPHQEAPVASRTDEFSQGRRFHRWDHLIL